MFLSQDYLEITKFEMTEQTFHAPHSDGNVVHVSGEQEFYPAFSNGSQQGTVRNSKEKETSISQDFTHSLSASTFETHRLLTIKTEPCSSDKSQYEDTLAPATLHQCVPQYETADVKSEVQIQEHALPLKTVHVTTVKGIGLPTEFVYTERESKTEQSVTYGHFPSSIANSNKILELSSEKFHSSIDIDGKCGLKTEIKIEQDTQIENVKERHEQLQGKTDDPCENKIPSSAEGNEKEKVNTLSQIDQVKHECSVCGGSFTSAECVFTHTCSMSHNRDSTKCDCLTVSCSVLVADCVKPTVRKQHQCDHCPYSFLKLSHLEKHLEQEICNSAVHSSVNLQKRSESPVPQNAQLKKIHTGDRKRAFQCWQCLATFSRSDHLKLHMGSHTGEKPYRCSLCQACFTSVSNLKTHVNLHSGEKPFTCHLCSASCSSLFNLRVHLRKHIGDKPYKCSECSAAFSYHTSLDKHLKSHEKRKRLVEKGYLCSQCGALFGHERQFQRHTRSHFKFTGEKGKPSKKSESKSLATETKAGSNWSL